MKIPLSLRAGDSSSWIDTPTVDNFGNAVGPSDWTLKYALRGATVLDLTAVEFNGSWKTSITTVESSALTPGIYYWQATATKGSDVMTVGSGQIRIDANLTAASPGFDGRSQIKKDLDAVQAAVRAMISGGAVAEYTIGTRSLRRIPLPELLVLESKLKIALRNEEKAAGISKSGNVFVRFK